MTDIKAEALHWIRSYKIFPQLHSVNKAGFPIGRTTWFPIEDDWSIHATGNAIREISRLRRAYGKGRWRKRS
jgi:hypothetical protein